MPVLQREGGSEEDVQQPVSFLIFVVVIAALFHRLSFCDRSTIPDRGNFRNCIYVHVDWIEDGGEGGKSEWVHILIGYFYR